MLIHVFREILVVHKSARARDFVLSTLGEEVFDYEMHDEEIRFRLKEKDVYWSSGKLLKLLLKSENLSLSTGVLWELCLLYECGQSSLREFVSSTAGVRLEPTAFVLHKEGFSAVADASFCTGFSPEKTFSELGFVASGKLLTVTIPFTEKLRKHFYKQALSFLA